MLRIRSVDHVLLLILVAVALVAGKQESACKYAKKTVIKFILNYKLIITVLINFLLHLSFKNIFNPFLVGFCSLRILKNLFNRRKLL